MSLMFRTTFAHAIPLLHDICRSESQSLRLQSMERERQRTMALKRCRYTNRLDAVGTDHRLPL